MRILFILLLLMSPAHARDVFQYVEAWHGSSLPPSMGQATDAENCERVIAGNLVHAENMGYAVNGQVYTDPATGISVRQSCIENSALEIAPVHPFAGTAPILAPVPAPSVGPGTDIWLVLGQSNAAAQGEGRHCARPNTWKYTGGEFFPLCDPVGQGSDGSPWARLADMMIGQMNLAGHPTNRIIVMNIARGGSSVVHWAAGGTLNASITAAVTQMIAAGIAPKRIFWHQGETDGSMTEADYVANFHSMLATVRAAGSDAPIYVAVATICNYRSSDNPSPQAVIERTPDWYIDKEAGRMRIRAAQASLPNGIDILPGPNTDLIPPERRVDGCHFSAAGLKDHAAGRFNILTQ